MPENRLQRTRDAYVETWEPQTIQPPKPSDRVMVVAGSKCYFWPVPNYPYGVQIECYSLQREIADKIFTEMGLSTTAQTRAIADAC